MEDGSTESHPVAVLDYTIFSMKSAEWYINGLTKHEKAFLNQENNFEVWWTSKDINVRRNQETPDTAFGMRRIWAGSSKAGEVLEKQNVIFCT